MRCGGIGATSPATPEIQDLVNSVKANAEQQANRKFDQFVAKSYASQVVRGVNYFVKVQVSNSEHIHLRIWKDFTQEVSLHSIQEHKTADDPIDYF